MAYVYHADAAAVSDAGLTDYTVQDAAVFSKYFNKTDYVWYLLSFGKCRKVVVLDKSGRVVHTTRVVGKCFKFPFLSKGEAVIGPCVTAEDHRGRGIYPSVLRHVRQSGGYRAYYMFVNEQNIPSIKGIEKADFQRIGTVKKRRGRWQISKEETAE